MRNCGKQLSISASNKCWLTNQVAFRNVIVCGTNAILSKSVIFRFAQKDGIAQSNDSDKTEETLEHVLRIDT